MRKIQFFLVAIILLVWVVNILPSQAESTRYLVRHLGVAPLLGPVPTLRALQSAVYNKYWTVVVPGMKLLGYCDQQTKSFYQAVMKGRVEETTLQDYFGSTSVDLPAMAWYGRTRKDAKVKVRMLRNITLDTGHNEAIWVVKFAGGCAVIPKKCGNICPSPVRKVTVRPTPILPTMEVTPVEPEVTETPKPRPTSIKSPEPEASPPESPKPSPATPRPTPEQPSTVPSTPPAAPPETPKTSPPPSPVPSPAPPPSSQAPPVNIYLNLPPATGQNWIPSVLDARSLTSVWSTSSWNGGSIGLTPGFTVGPITNTANGGIGGQGGQGGQGGNATGGNATATGGNATVTVNQSQSQSQSQSQAQSP